MLMHLMLMSGVFVFMDRCPLFGMRPFVLVLMDMFVAVFMGVDVAIWMPVFMDVGMGVLMFMIICFHRDPPRQVPYSLTRACTTPMIPPRMPPK